MKKLLTGLLGLAILVACFLPAMADSQTHLGQVVSYRISQRGDWFFLKFRAENEGKQTDEIQIGPLDKQQTNIYANVLSEPNVHAYMVTAEPSEDAKEGAEPATYYDFFVVK
ncbi:MAG: hypothetical protein KC800_34320 [Candidatus Eremiobacteraeota bacterium]|nr:hypothetical protein [Candidatus Eremiobacteraeota bacterium]